MVKVKVQLDEGAQMPSKALSGDSAYDLRVNNVTVRKYVWPDKWEDFSEFRLTTDNEIRPYPWQAIIDTGVHVQPEEGWGFESRPNSRSGKSLFRWAFYPGTIDGNYTGSIKVILEPRFSWVRPTSLPKRGEVCCQIKLEKIHEADFELTDKLDETERGENGFGSTEKKV